MIIVLFEAILKSRNGTIIGQYVNTRTKIIVKCQNNHIFEIKPNNATNGKWCRPCRLSESNGERLVREFLIQKNIQYKSEISFDFYFVYGDRHYIVKFDGIQHFVQIDFFCPNEEAFKKRREVDIVKTAAALNAGYYIIRIAYSDIENISDIIDGYINDPTPQSRLLLSDMDEYKWLLDGVRLHIK